MAFTTKTFPPATQMRNSRNSNSPAPLPTIDPGVNKPGFDFLHLWHTILEKLWILILCTVAGLLLAAGYLIRTPKLYRSHLGLEVEFQEPTAIAGDETSARMRSAFLATQETLRTIEQNLTSAGLLARVVRSEGLAKDGGKALLGQSIIREESSAQPTAKPNATPNPSADTSFTPLEQALASSLYGQVKTVIRRGTRLIDVFVTNRSPEMAQRVADAIGREYLRNYTERRASSSQETLRYLLEEEERLKASLQKSEAAVAEYKAKTPDALQLGGGAAATGSQTGAGSTTSRGGMVEERLQEINTRLTTARAERMRLEHELEQIQAAGEDVDALLSVPGVANAPAVNERRRELAQVETAVATLSQRYKSKHPKMIATQAALTEGKRALQHAVLLQPAVLRNALEQARSTEENTANALREQEKAALALNRAAIGYQELARQAETDRALYESVLRQIKATDVTKGAKASPVSIVQRPGVSGRPVSPKPALSIALGLLGGIAAGLGLIFGLDALDRSVKTVDQAERTFGLPVVAAIPESSGREVSRRSPRNLEEEPQIAQYRLVSEVPEGPPAEAFRTLRAALSLLGPEDERRVYLFTSAVPSEGKSFTSANYALALAQQGHRVLLIDGDLRRPSLHRIFGVVGSDHQLSRGPADTPGLVDCLVGGMALTEAARRASFGRGGNGSGQALLDPTSTGELWVVTAGRRAPNPAELLAGHTFADIAATAAGSFDRVVIDSAPVLAVSDTLLMAPHVQTVCLVVRAAATARNAVQRAIGLLATANTHPAGIILNRLPQRRGTGYYYYYASPGYGAAAYRGGYDESASRGSRPRETTPTAG